MRPSSIMHQLPRPSPRTASSASSPRTNPLRTNNQRDRGFDRLESASDTMSSNENTADDYGEGSESSDERNAALAKENNKLNQVIRVWRNLCTSLATCVADWLFCTAIPRQSCPYYHVLANFSSAELQQRGRETIQ